MSNSKTPITAEEIEAKLDEIEEEENEDFNKWFNSYVGNDKTESEVKVADETVDADNTNDSNEHENETDADNTNDSNETEVDNNANNDVETEVDDNVNANNTNDSNETEADNNANNDAETEADKDESNQQLTLTEVQGKSKSHVKSDVVITKHRKHRSRKTELTASLPPKAPVVLQESEQGVVEIGTKKGKKLTDDELEQKIHKSYNKTVESIKDQVDEMIQNGNCRQLELIDYTPGSEKYNVFKHYLLDPLLVPKRCTTKFNLNEYINSITVFKYNCFDTPNVAMQHPIPEKVIFAQRLNDVFGYEFVDSKTGDFHFKDLDAQLLKYIATQQKKGTLSFEYRIIKSALGKLILNLNTDIELALRNNEHPTLNSAFKQVIVKDIQYMKFIQDQEGKTFMSWKHFLDTLLGLGADKLIFVFDTYRNLNVKLDKAYNTDFLIENLLGNTLKCYLPSVALNYFYAVKSIYIIARLSSLYIQNQLFKNKSHEQIMNDLYTIAVSGVIVYENKNFIYKNASRTLPSYDKPLSNETKLYILNHLLTGGQYFILKMLEESLPVIAADLVE